MNEFVLMKKYLILGTSGDKVKMTAAFDTCTEAVDNLKKMLEDRGDVSAHEIDSTISFIREKQEKYPDVRVKVPLNGGRFVYHFIPLTFG